jgi:sterol desaturase/sphingolipid hydroxylase (fatty acid hydroxylase superfamily)
MPFLVWIQSSLEASILVGALSALILYYFLYEYLHYCMHIPKRRWLETTAWFRWLDSHHHMHHKRHFNNLNVVLPLADIVFGTLIPAKDHLTLPDREDGATQVHLLLSESQIRGKQDGGRGVECRLTGRPFDYFFLFLPLSL